MPYLITWEASGVYTKYWGQATGEDVTSAGAAKRNDPRISSCRYTISDFLEVEALTLTRFTTLMTAAQDHNAPRVERSLKIALVVDKPELAELARTYADSPLIRNTFRVGLFPTLAEARAWAEAD
ncbi:MAG: hypothetical protein JNM82_07905 [Rhodocyclaceae bacterium]|nr:hypothetical protein [Rhodocyclaceae bacterium]